MTEMEWLACAEPNKIFMFLGESASHRKMRHFAIACCRRVWHLLRDERSRKAVEAADELADDGTKFHCRPDDPIARAAYAAMMDARDAYHAARPDEDWDDAKEIDPFQSAAYAAYDAYAYSRPFGCGAAACAIGCEQSSESSFNYVAQTKEGADQCRLMREIIGNPFRSVILAPSCLTPAIVSLAQTIYDGRAFDRMPELADALEKAGCSNGEILEHCRAPGPHVRGCWVLDLILGKV